MYPKFVVPWIGDRKPHPCNYLFLCISLSVLILAIPPHLFAEDSNAVIELGRKEFVCSWNRTQSLTVSKVSKMGRLRPVFDLRLRRLRVSREHADTSVKRRALKKRIRRVRRLKKRALKLCQDTLLPPTPLAETPTPTSTPTPIPSPEIPPIPPEDLPSCGDGEIGAQEICECGSDGICGTSDDQVAGTSCTDFGASAGVVSCQLNCTGFDVSACQFSESVLYADANLSGPCDESYDINARTCTAESTGASADPTIQGIAEKVNPGDTVLVRGGLYQEGVQIPRGGLPNLRVRFAAYPGEQAIIDGQRETGCFYLSYPNAHHVTLDGFTCKNIGDSGLWRGGVHIAGADEIIVRNFTIFNENWNREDYVTGVNVTGPADNVLVEDNTIYYMQTGIGARHSTGHGQPSNLVIRNNHVHHIMVADWLQQNHAIGICPSNGVRGAVIENNLVHHCDDFAVGSNEMWGPTVILRNIVYGSDHVDGGGGGNGIKIKPKWGNGGSPYHDIVAYNISLLNRGGGIHVIKYGDIWGSRVYNNVSVFNLSNGFDVGVVNPGVPAQPGDNLEDHYTYAKNNIAAYNVGRDFEVNNYSGPPHTIDHNYIQDGRGYHWSQVSGDISGSDPGFVDISPFLAPLNDENIPTFLEPLSATPQNPLSDGFEGFDSAADAIAYAKEQLRARLGLTPDSILVDRGTVDSILLDISPDLLDLFYRPGCDHPDTESPWPGVPSLGLVDFGAIETSCE